jgi:cell division septation protein DedD
MNSSSATVEAATDIAGEIEQNATIEAVEEPIKPAMVAQTEVVATEPPPAMQTTTAVADQQATAALKTGTTAAQTELLLDKAEVAEEPATLAMNSSSATVEAAPDITREIETTTTTPVLPDAKTGKWVINISSYTRKSTAERMLAVFKQKGIEAEVFTTMINDKPMHRIRVAGFQSSRAAKAGIPAIEQALGLEDVWVSRR